MQYFIKFYNKDTGEFVGYYKDTGRNCITAMPKGTKYFDNIKEALLIVNELSEGFMRGKDGHWYHPYGIIYCDHKKSIKQKDINIENKEDLEDELDAFIRKNSSSYRERSTNNI